VVIFPEKFDGLYARLDRTRFLANFHNKTFDMYGVTVHTGIMKG
jgi:hypothetical protein